MPPEECRECPREDKFIELGDQLAALRNEFERLAKRTNEQIIGAFSAFSAIERKLDRILEGLRVGAIVPAEPFGRASSIQPVLSGRESIPWDPDEDTGMHELPVWARRAKESASVIADLKAQLSAAQATIVATDAERKRQSIRAAKLEDQRWSKWQKITGIVIAILTALGGGVGLSQLFR